MQFFYFINKLKISKNVAQNNQRKFMCHENLLFISFLVRLLLLLTLAEFQLSLYEIWILF